MHFSAIIVHVGSNLCITIKLSEYQLIIVVPNQRYLNSGSSSSRCLNA